MEKYYCFIVTSWDLLIYTSDYYGFSVQGGKKGLLRLRKSLGYCGQADHLDTQC